MGSHKFSFIYKRNTVIYRPLIPYNHMVIVLTVNLVNGID